MSEVRDELVQRDRSGLPHNSAVEGSILGGIILHPQAIAYCPDLEIDDFYDAKHKVVFTAMRNLEAAGTPIDVVTLENEIERGGKLDAVGGAAFLGELALRVPTVDNIETYAKIVKHHATTRSVILMLSEMLQEARTGLSEGEQLVHDVTTAMMRVRTGNDQPIVTLAQLVAEEFARVEHDVSLRLSGKFAYAGVPCGIAPIDERVGGHPIGLLSMYIARPACGKTTIAMMFGRTARQHDADSLLASYEDAGQSFGQRGLAQVSGIATEVLRARKLGADDMVELTARAAYAKEMGELHIAASGMSVDALARRVRRENLRRKAAGLKPLKQLVVDYIQKMPIPQWARSRDEGIGYISKVLCDLAVAEEMAVVAMCQLNREIEKRDDHRPRISDIRDSGNLEQDGKLICGLYYPHHYEPEDYPEEEFHVLVLKNHQGESHGDIKMFWNRKTHEIFNTPLEFQRSRMRVP